MKNCSRISHIMFCGRKVPSHGQQLDTANPILVGCMNGNQQDWHCFEHSVCILWPSLFCNADDWESTRMQTRAFNGIDKALKTDVCLQMQWQRANCFLLVFCICASNWTSWTRGQSGASWTEVFRLHFICKQLNLGCGRALWQSLVPVIFAAWFQQCDANETIFQWRGDFQHWDDALEFHKFASENCWRSGAERHSGWISSVVLTEKITNGCMVTNCSNILSIHVQNDQLSNQACQKTLMCVCVWKLNRKFKPPKVFFRDKHHHMWQLCHQSELPTVPKNHWQSHDWVLCTFDCAHLGRCNCGEMARLQKISRKWMRLAVL